MAKSYTCRDCGEQFPSRSELMIHKQECDPEPEPKSLNKGLFQEEVRKEKCLIPVSECSEGSKVEVLMDGTPLSFILLATKRGDYLEVESIEKERQGSRRRR